MNEAPAILENLKWAHAPSAGLPWWVWGLAVLLLLAGGAGLFFWLRRRREKAAFAPPARPAHETALEALEKLRALLSEENYLDFIIEVSRILRVYIQARFELRAPHRSTEEFLSEASQSQLLSSEYQELLGDFLRRCDLVKFARRSAALHQMEALFRVATQFVHDTTPQPESKQVAAAPL